MTTHRRTHAGKGGNVWTLFSRLDSSAGFHNDEKGAVAISYRGLVSYTDKSVHVEMSDGTMSKPSNITQTQNSTTVTRTHVTLTNTTGTT